MLSPLLALKKAFLLFLSRCVKLLSSTSIGAAARATRAFHAGFWAAVARDTDTPYHNLVPLGEIKIAHYVCIRCKKGSPFRTTAAGPFALLCAEREAVITEFFGSITELE